MGGRVRAPATSWPSPAGDKPPAVPPSDLQRTRGVCTPPLHPKPSLPLTGGEHPGKLQFSIPAMSLSTIYLPQRTSGLVCPSIHPSLTLIPPTHIRLSTHPPIYLSICPPINLSIYPPIYLFLCPPIYLSTYPSSIHLYICPSIRLSMCICPSIRAAQSCTLQNAISCCHLVSRYHGEIECLLGLVLVPVAPRS